MFCVFRVKFVRLCCFLWLTECINFSGFLPDYTRSSSPDFWDEGRCRDGTERGISPIKIDTHTLTGVLISDLSFSHFGALCGRTLISISICLVVSFDPIWSAHRGSASFLPKVFFPYQSFPFTVTLRSFSWCRLQATQTIKPQMTTGTVIGQRLRYFCLLSSIPYVWRTFPDLPVS